MLDAILAVDAISTEGRDSFALASAEEEVTDVVDEFAVNIPIPMPVPRVDTDDERASESDPLI